MAETLAKVGPGSGGGLEYCRKVWNQPVFPVGQGRVRWHAGTKHTLLGPEKTSAAWVFRTMLIAIWGAYRRLLPGLVFSCGWWLVVG